MKGELAVENSVRELGFFSGLGKTMISSLSGWLEDN